MLGCPSPPSRALVRHRGTESSKISFDNLLKQTPKNKSQNQTNEKPNKINQKRKPKTKKVGVLRARAGVSLVVCVFRENSPAPCAQVVVTEFNAMFPGASHPPARSRARARASAGDRNLAARRNRVFRDLCEWKCSLRTARRVKLEFLNSRAEFRNSRKKRNWRKEELEKRGTGELASSCSSS